MSKTVKILAAAAIGFAAGLLLAPKSGDETRKDLKRKAREAQDYTAEKVGQAKAAARDGYKSLRAGADEVRGEFDEFMGSAQGAGDELAKEAKTRGARVATTGEKVGRKVREDVRKHLK